MIRFLILAVILALFAAVGLFLTSCAGVGARQDGRITETYQRWDIPSLFENNEDAPPSSK